MRTFLLFVIAITLIFLLNTFLIMLNKSQDYLKTKHIKVVNLEDCYSKDGKDLCEVEVKMLDGYDY